MITFTVGFTGTRSGMTAAQRETVDQFLLHLLDKRPPGKILAVHGDCEGADTNFHEACFAFRELYTRERLIIRIRPCSHSSRAWNKGADEVMPVKPPLDRNVDIAQDCSVLIATPPTFEEIRRSGTWHTIRQARKLGKPMCIVWPDGTFTREG